MPTKRRAITRAPAPAITPDLRRKIERLLELETMHLAAIRGLDEAFHGDGRHEELLRLLPEVYGPLRIRPWEDADALLAAALAEGD